MSTALILTLALALSSAAVAQEEGNLLVNGGFEKWETDEGAPPGWVFLIGQSPTVLRKDAAEKHGGVACLRFEFGGANNTGWVGQRVSGIHPDTEYRLGGFAKVARDTKIPMIVNVEPNLDGMEIARSEEWAPWQFVFNSREATEVLPQFRFRGSGTVWLDDLRLEQVSEPGTKVLPERRELLKLVEYQAHPVAPETNTDEWTKPFVGTKPPSEAFKRPGKPGYPTWKIGQWARYLCHDDLLVPSQFPEKRPHIALLDCAVVGAETVGGRRHYWYQCVVRVARYWVAQAQGRYDSRKKILLSRPRKVVLSFLVNGPDFREVRRYQLKVDDEPNLEYTDGTRAVLPRLNIDHARLLPVVQPEKGEAAEGGVRVTLRGENASTTMLTNSSVPATGLLKWEYHRPQLDRKATLVNWEDTGARDERVPAPAVLVRLARPPYLAVSFDGFGEVKHFAEMAGAGAELFQALTVPYLGDARRYFNQMPAFFYDCQKWDADIFDVCRSNFLGFSPHLDEPYQRQRKPNEYVKRGEAMTMTEAASLYSEALRKLLQSQPIWPGEQVMDYNSPASASWYSARVGAAGFVLENARLVSDIEVIQRVTGKADARELADELYVACLAGTAQRFGTWWGQGIYRWVPERYWKDTLTHFAGRGAQYLGFWIDGGAGVRDPELQFYQQVLAALPAIKQIVKNIKAVPRRAEAALVVPDGYVLGLAGCVPNAPWGIVDFADGQRITDEVIRRASAFHDQGRAFDVVVDDPGNPVEPGAYKEVVRVAAQ